MMYVYINGKLVVVETNLAYAISFWKARKQTRRKDGVNITWSTK